jgi:hypothetical protein
MVVIEPTGVPVLGNTSVRWVATIADTAAPKLATELNAASPASLDISCYLLADAWEPGQDVSKGAPPRRLCSRTQYERFSTTTLQLGDLRYVIAPQGAAGSDGKKAYEVLTEGLSGYFVERLGLDAKTSNWAVGQFVNVTPVTLGPRIIVGDTDENGDYTVMQPVSVTGPRAENVAIVT